jgi:UDP-galactose transporter B1
MQKWNSLNRREHHSRQLDETVDDNRTETFYENDFNASGLLISPSSNDLDDSPLSGGTSSPSIVGSSRTSPAIASWWRQYHRPLNLLYCALGILVFYFIFGLEQEKITKSKYGEHKEKFTYTQALVFVQCVVNAIFARLMLHATKHHQGADNTPWLYYALAAFSYLAAMIASNHSLQFVSYPTQVLGKSCKPIPIMFFGVFFAHKKYPFVKYIFVLMIVAGVAMFVYKDEEVKPGEHHPSFGGWGEFLLVLSLACDGTTGAIQERIRAAFTFKSHNMMLMMNVWSALYLVVGVVITGELASFSAFVGRYPSVLFHMVTLSVASALGQYFIFKTVTDFGPLPCSIITTTRKLFTILASVIIFQNPLTGRQMFATLIVFIALGLDGAYSGSKKNPAKA